MTFISKLPPYLFNDLNNKNPKVAIGDFVVKCPPYSSNDLNNKNSKGDTVLAKKPLPTTGSGHQVRSI